jgi:hypothetical protein
MKVFTGWLPQIVLSAGIWTAVNGLLHTIFVLAGEHGKQYDRDLLRLLTDGLLLTSIGVILILTFPALKQGNNTALFIALTASITVVVYCMMIWPFLKSVGTLLIHTLTLVCILLSLFTK